MSSQVDVLVEAHMRAGNAPGAAVAILQNGEVLKVGTYGEANAELGAPVRRDSVFELASLTKPLTVAAIGMPRPGRTPECGRSIGLLGER